MCVQTVVYGSLPIIKRVCIEAVVYGSVPIIKRVCIEAVVYGSVPIIKRGCVEAVVYGSAAACRSVQAARAGAAQVRGADAKEAAPRLHRHPAAHAARDLQGDEASEQRDADDDRRAARPEGVDGRQLLHERPPALVRQVPGGRERRRLQQPAHIDREHESPRQLAPPTPVLPQV